MLPKYGGRDVRWSVPWSHGGGRWRDERHHRALREWALWWRCGYISGYLCRIKKIPVMWRLKVHALRVRSLSSYYKGLFLYGKHPALFWKDNVLFASQIFGISFQRHAVSLGLYIFNIASERILLATIICSRVQAGWFDKVPFRLKNLHRASRDIRVAFALPSANYPAMWGLQ